MSEWRRPASCSTHSCIEVMNHGRAVEIRNSKFAAADPYGVCLASLDEWRVFVAAIKAGEFDDLEAPSVP